MPTSGSPRQRRDRARAPRSRTGRAREDAPGPRASARGATRPRPERATALAPTLPETRRPHGDHEGWRRLMADEFIAPAPSGSVSLSLRQRAQPVARALVGTMDVRPGSIGHTILRGVNMGGLGLPPRRGTPQILTAYSEMP